ncbi:alkaline phosphatase family protein [Tessaracoccus antarcticus]|uniref:Alkaline phosphatase family protein n=1 Tax=Tessaracoccus antarcticus TaxID=2479848 RepID=A0A3M0G6F7_9ACTN|nr:nucleotide pyrophosphatase/phosphodiesterase family protein [Tessaracoccus antarcticus]RMB60078.1 alkaline phosphatase family protein [Tessaracoccus antarcticus]
MHEEFIAPRYGGATLASLLPSIEASLSGTTPVLGLPRASRYVLLLVDGLGWYPLQAHADHAEMLAGHLDVATELTCSVPSTTATSLTSLGCGVPPGQHGVVGYTFLDPATDRLLNALTWDGGPDDIQGFRCHDTAFQRMAARGQHSGAVSLSRFADSALTQLAFGGTEHLGVEKEGQSGHFVDLVLQSLSTHQVVYCYERMLDHDGHGYGVGSWQWLDRLARIDDMVAELADHLPVDTCLLVTGDHGMVNVPTHRKIVADDETALAGCRHIGGEARFRQLYCDNPRRVAASWSEFMGDRAHVLTRDEALAAGWFGLDVDPRVVPRIGDVLVAMRADWGVMTSAFPGEFSLVGMHGSLTAEEMVVPLFAFGPQ